MTRQGENGPTTEAAGPRPSDRTHLHPGVGASANANGPRACKVAYDCPVCGGNAEAAFKPNRDGIWRWFIHCFSCPADGYLAELAAAVGAPHGAALLEDPQPYLPAERATATPAQAPPRPSRAQARRWAYRLRRGGPPLDWLLGERGLSLSVLRATRVGWDAEAAHIVLPSSRGGEVAAYKTCRVGGKLMKPAGSGAWDWPLYPEPQRASGWTWLVEGEWDALRLRSIGVPAVSVTGGKNHWRDEWAEQLQGLYVRVMYDVGAEPEARKAVRALRRAGVDARHFPARLLGLTAKHADVSDYLNAGGDPERLCRRRVA